MEGIVPPLTRPVDLSPSLLRYLSQTFRAEKDLSRFAEVEVELKNRCSDLEAILDDLSGQLSRSIAGYFVRSEETGALLRSARAGLSNLRSALRRPSEGLISHDPPLYFRLLVICCISMI